MEEATTTTTTKKKTKIYKNYRRSPHCYNNLLDKNSRRHTLIDLYISLCVRECICARTCVYMRVCT